MGKTDDRETKLFTKKSHHVCRLPPVEPVLKGERKPDNKFERTIHGAVEEPRDTTVVSHLAKQMYPGGVRYTQEAFKEATSRPYGYLLVDLKHETPEHLRLPTNVFSR